MENKGNCIDGMIMTNKIQCREAISTNMDQLGENLNFDTQDNLDKGVNDFSDYLSEIVSPFVEVKPYSNAGKIQKRSQSHCVIMEDKPWFNDKCKSLHISSV